MLDLRCEDAIKVLKEMPSESIDLFISDVPYKTTARGCSGSTGGMLTKDINKKGKVFENNDVKPIDYLPEIYRILKQGTHCYIMTNNVNLIEMLNTAVSCGFHFVKSLIWDKGNKICNPFYMSQFEYILFFRKGKAKRINHCGTADIISVPNIKTKDAEGKNIHDTEKPLELMKILVDNSSNEGDTVMDCFMGSNPVGAACKELNRNFIGVEIDPKYFAYAKKRVE